jgi:hypothetical protein
LICTDISLWLNCVINIRNFYIIMLIYFAFVMFYPKWNLNWAAIYFAGILYADWCHVEQINDGMYYFGCNFYLSVCLLYWYLTEYSLWLICGIALYWKSKLKIRDTCRQSWRADASNRWLMRKSFLNWNSGEESWRVFFLKKKSGTRFSGVSLLSKLKLS